MRLVGFPRKRSDASKPPGSPNGHRRGARILSPVLNRYSDRAAGGARSSAARRTYGRCFHTPLPRPTGPTVDPVRLRVRCLAALTACRRTTALGLGLLAAGPVERTLLLLDERCRANHSFRLRLRIPEGKISWVDGYRTAAEPSKPWGCGNRRFGRQRGGRPQVDRHPERGRSCGWLAGLKDVRS